MNASRPDNEAIFHAARDIPDLDRRREYVREACGHDVARIALVEALLAAAASPDSLLDRPAAATPVATIDRPTAESPGTVIGSYKLLEEIGEGGFGVVFMAEQTKPVRRKVALKILKPGMDTRQVVARFEAERQALALMDHPNIARVLDGGQTATGRPYFVMDLVKGLPITEYCDQARLTARERLELFVHLCQAVQHAHQKAVIHRDLKPSNVLVTVHDTTAVVKVIDFGVAKALGQELTEKTLFTGFAQLVGTPLYMSPEQAGQSGLDIDTRSDIYTLGVLLYELLTGTTPFDQERLRAAGYDELRRIIREEEPPRPSTRVSTLRPTAVTVSANRKSDPKKLGKLIRGELDWIVMKALDKDRNRRYETASAFAADVQRYLADEPVQACPPSAWYRFQKFARRNKAVLGTAAVIAGVLLLGIAISTSQAIRASEAEILAERRLKAEKIASSAEAEQRQLANDEKKRAETNLRKAREAVDQLFTEVAEKLAGQPHMEQIRRRLLEDALEFYQGFLKQKGTDPEMRHETARAYWRVGGIHEYLGNGSQAEAAQREGVALFEKLVTDFPRVPIYREDLIACRALLGYRMLWVPKPEEAIELRRRDLADWEKLAADFPTVPRYQQRIAYAQTDLANALKYPGRRYPEAEHHYRQALTAWKKYQASFPKMPADRFGLAHSHLYLGEFLRGTGRVVEAGPELREGLALSRQLVVDDPGNFSLKTDLARALGYFGHWLRRTGKTHEAMKHYHEAIDIYEKHRNSFPHDAAALDMLGGRYGDVSAALLVLGRTEEAEAARRSSVAIYAKLVADHPGVNPYPNHLGQGQFHLGLLLYYTKKEQDAADVFRNARDVLEKLAKERPGEPDHQIALGWLLADCPAPQFRDPGRAIELAKRALQRNPLDASNWLLFGVANYRAGNWKGAIEATQKSMGLCNGGNGGHWIVLAVAHWQLGDKDEARKWYDKAAARLKKSWSGDLQYHFAQREAAALLGVEERPAAKKKDKTPEENAEQVYRREIAAHEKLTTGFPTPDPGFHNRLGRNYQALMALLRDSNRPQDAIQVGRQAVVFYDGLAAKYPREMNIKLELAKRWAALGILLQQTGTAKEAEETHRKALTCFEKLSADFPQVPGNRVEIGHILWQLGALYVDARRLREAEEVYRKALLVFEKLAADLPKEAYYQLEAAHTCWAQLGPLLAGQPSRVKDAEQVYRQGLAAHQKLAANFPTRDPEFHRRLGANYQDLMNLLKNHQRLADAIKVGRQGVGFFEELAAKYPSEMNIQLEWAKSWAGLGNLLQQTGKEKEAEEASRAALDIYQKLTLELPKEKFYRRELRAGFFSLARLHGLLGNVPEAQKVYRQLLQLDPKSAVAHNNLAWLLATCAEGRFRDPKQAVELAKKAVELDPKAGTYWNTLGAASYRAGDWQGAIAALKKSMELRKGGDSNDWFFLAMAKWRLDEKDEARTWYGKAVGWMDKNQPKNEELRRFRVEAAELLGIEQPSKDNAK